MCIGGEGGIRTHVPFRTRRFRGAPVTTTSVPLRRNSRAICKRPRRSLETIHYSNPNRPCRRLRPRTSAARHPIAPALRRVGVGPNHHESDAWIPHDWPWSPPPPSPSSPPSRSRRKQPSSRHGARRDGRRAAGRAGRAALGRRRRGRHKATTAASIDSTGSRPGGSSSPSRSSTSRRSGARSRSAPTP